MNKKKLLLAISTVLMISLGTSALQGYVIESGSTEPSEYTSMIYNWGAPDTNKYYQDGIAYLDDLGLMICDDSGGTPPDKWLGLTYYMNGQYSPANQLVSYGSGTNTLAKADISTSFQGMSCKRTGYEPLTISPVPITDTPETKTAAFPAEVYVQVADSSTGGNSEFIGTNSVFAGSYSGSASYSYSANQISTSISRIKPQADVAGRDFGPDASGRGISDKRPLIIGICGDQAGQACDTGAEKLTSSDFPRVYNFNITKANVNDQVVHTRYAVANGKDYDRLDIGADLSVSSLSVSKDPVYYSQVQNVSFTVVNNGNVPVTSNFNVNVEIVDSQGNTVDSNSFPVSQKITQNGGSMSFQYNWKALSESGNYNARVTVDPLDDITEISESDNVDSRSFELKPITLPEIIVNEEVKDKNESTFPDPGVPYNLTLVMKNSDNDTLTNSTVELIENHGTSSFSPTQEINNDKVTKTVNKVVFETDENGVASITLIPTGNLLLADKYDTLDVQDKLDYSIRLEGEQSDGTEFKFINDGKLEEFYPMSVSDPSTYDGSTTSDLPNLESYAKLSMNSVYTIFAEFWGAVT